ncbi:tetraprenyl-beta-curcumene synthase [Geomicrobium halophilum]|uniref:Tetraprenyl-beta-curcumene synthase n=1 Tax=Geomicrobium halophilum TaxID=549000 RepID=A0A841PLH5_9BACL|nr:tetraprenyl-beta-curcumene synthase family protein [Geomicrobium halophilum]MBB6448066.1 tetraprenyl-beta-curcumene synthase [Geomicrobium halophilum]
MNFKVPKTPWMIVYYIYKETVPEVHRQLDYWKKKAGEIPDEHLSKQASWTIDDKTFHCEGGSILAMLAGGNKEAFIRFLVAYQTICDFLDTLCDKSESQDPDDFRALHQALLDGLTPGENLKDYYRVRGGYDDGGYLHELVKTCQETVQALPGFPAMQPVMKELSGYYVDFQVYKHVPADEREDLLIAFHERNQPFLPEMRWYEFSCCVASTLGLYCLAAYAATQPRTEEEATTIKNAYFPWLQGVHIMLDYFIDQEEDLAEGEMNFAAYYESEDEMVSRFRYMDKRAEESLDGLPDEKFHRLIKRGLFAIYLADGKVQENPEMKRTAKRLIKLGGLPTAFFYLNRWIFRRKKVGE